MGIEVLCTNPKCFKSYVPKRDWQKYCSVSCRKAHRTEVETTKLVRLPLVVTCYHCQQELEVKKLKGKQNGDRDNTTN